MNVFGPILLLGILLIAAPIGLSVADVEIGGMVSAVLLGFGVILTLISGIALVISNLYVRTAPDEAFVRSGMGGVKPIIDGGAIVVGVIHEKVTVSLRTIRLVVARTGTGALLTHDKLRADITAEFFVKVEAERNDVLNAARSFGDRMKSPDLVKEVVQDKFISALRTVAATMSLEDLNSKRDDFLRAVKAIVVADLKPNGLTLESATISYLDMTDTGALNERNIFDAQGLKSAAVIVQNNLTEKNRIEREGQEARATRDVDNTKKMLQFAQERAEAEATQKADIAAKNAEQDCRAQEAEIEKGMALKVAGEKAAQKEEIAVQEREKAVRVATQQTQQADEVAAQEREKAVRVATQQTQQAQQVAEQERAKAVAKSQEEAAKAEAARQNAEAEAEGARQEVETVKVKQTADRLKQKRIIDAEAAGQEAYVAAQKKADADAYEVTAKAEAAKKAAEADAAAITKRADADKAAAIAAAEGKRASEMIPVDVKKAEVDVEEKRVEVDKRRIAEVVTPELEARAQHGHVAQEFELGKLRIQADVEIGKAAAEALGKALTGADMTLFGTPEDAARMVTNLATGMGLGQYANGVLQTLPPELISAAAEGGKSGLALLGAIAQRLGVKIPQVPEIPVAPTKTPTTSPAAPANGEPNET